MNLPDVKVSWAKEYIKDNNQGHPSKITIFILKKDKDDPSPVLLIEGVTSVPKNDKSLEMYQRTSSEVLDDGEVFFFKRRFSIRVSTLQEILRDVEEVLAIKL